MSDPFTGLGILAPCWNTPLQGSGQSWDPAVSGDTITINFASFQVCNIADEIASGNLCNFTATLSINDSPSSGDDFPNNQQPLNICISRHKLKGLYTILHKGTSVLAHSNKK